MTAIMSSTQEKTEGEMFIAINAVQPRMKATTETIQEGM
jgi:hypothetical protein